MGGLVVQRFSANFTTRNPLDHRLMQRLSGTAMDFLVVAAISDHQRGGGTGGVRAVLPPTAWKQLADAQVDGWRRWDPEASPRPHRLWSRGDEVANVVELGCFRN